MTELDIFTDALELTDPHARSRFLDEACRAEPVQRQRIEALLRNAAQASRYLESPLQGLNAMVAGPLTAATVAERLGTQIGPYKLLQQIGEGGMGVVWMAEQTEPVQRKVALKVIKPGMDSRQVIARFEAERQALALMDHVNIARVIDGGATDQGRPYFVMELVHGVPITKYCDDNHLTLRQRLELFVPVCQAIQHAHQKGIIHRDIKPTNVMVTLYDGQPAPKVIDFGVAKAAGQSLTDKTLVTGFGTIVGTLEYMSPEQAETNQLDIDTRSDIYSLGVLLYELLTGSTPFSRQELEQAGILEMLRVIREEEPSKPSTKLSTADGLPTLAANRGTEPARLTRLVRGELDWIVMKALEKDRSRRYETAGGLALDVQRYLNDEAVQACPPSAGYRWRKFVRRNKLGVAVAGLVLFFLVLLGSGVGWAVRDRSARDAEAARQQAGRQAKVAGQVELIQAEIDLLQREQQWAAALEAARRAQAAVAGGEADSVTAQHVRELLLALEFIDRLEQIRMERATFEEGKFDNVGADRKYARAFRDYGVDALELAVETSIARLTARPALAIPLAASLDDWAYARRQASKNDPAGWKRLVAVARGTDPEPLRDKLRSTWLRPRVLTLDELRKLADSIGIRAQHPATLVSLARTLQLYDRSDAVIRLLRDAQSAYPGDFWLNYNLGVALHQQQDFEGATRYYTAAASIRPKSIVAYANLGNALCGHKKPDEAITAYRKCHELDPKFAPAYHGEGRALHIQKKLNEAIAAYHRALELDPLNPGTHYDLIRALHDQRNLDDVIVEARQAVAQGAKSGAAAPLNATRGNLLVGLLAARAWELVISPDPKSRDPQRALDLAQEAAALVPNHATCLKALGVAHYRLGNWEAAVQSLEKARLITGYSSDESVGLFILSMAYGQLNEKEKARTLFEQAAQWRIGDGLTDQELRLLSAEAAAVLGLEVPPALQEPPVLTPGPTLLTPAAGDTLENGARDLRKLMVWEFDWSDVPGATKYHLHVIRPSAEQPRIVPTINNSKLTSSSYRHEPKNQYVPDAKRLGWHWKVRAQVEGTWTDWSEERIFAVLPLNGNQPAGPKK